MTDNSTGLDPIDIQFALGGMTMGDDTLISDIELDAFGTPLQGPPGQNGVAGANGTNGRSPVLRRSGGVIQWQLIGDSVWQDLITIDNLLGPQGPEGETGAAGANGTNGTNGTDGTDGTNGLDPEFQIAEGYVQWRLVGAANWINLILVATLTGPQGSKGDTGSQGVPGTTGLQGPIGPDGTKGDTGQEIELQISDGYIQMKYPSDSSWTNLLALADVMGEAGPQGAIGPDGPAGRDGVNGTNGTDGAPGTAGAAGPSIELQKTSTEIQWRVVGAGSWINLVALADITGPQGPAGSGGGGSGTIEVSDGTNDFTGITKIIVNGAVVGNPASGTATITLPTVTPVVPATIVQISPALYQGGNIVLNVPATAGNTLLLVASGIGFNYPTGFQALATSSNSGNQYIHFAALTAVGGETTFAVTTSDHSQWIIYEVANFGGFTTGNTAGNLGNPFSCFLPTAPVAGALTLFAMTHDSSNGWTVNALTGVTYDYINPSTGGNHTGVFGHTVADFGGSFTGISDGANSNFAYFSLYHKAGAGGGSGGGGGGSTTLAGLTDVDETTLPTDGQSLIYTGSSSKWKPGNPTVPSVKIPTNYDKHLFWRLFCNNTNAGNNTLSEVVFAATYGGASQTTGGTPIESSHFTGTGSYAAPNAFDNDITTLWASNSGSNEWIGYQFAAPVAVAEARITARNDSYFAQSPTSVVVQYSDDGVTWTQAWVPTLTAWSAGLQQILGAPYTTVTGSVPDAISDGNQYIRKNATWQPYDNKTSSVIAPHDFDARASTGAGTNYNGGIWFGNSTFMDVTGTLYDIVVAYEVSANAINATPAIYADNAGAPGALLASGPAVANMLAGDNVLPLTTPLVVMAGQRIWIGVYEANISGITATYTASAGGSDYSAYFVGNPPISDPAPSVTVWSGRKRMFARGLGSKAVTGRRFKLPFFFTTTPTAYEVVSFVMADEAFVIPANFAGTQPVVVGTNPTSSFTMGVTLNGAQIGTISISTAGVVTLATTGGLPIAVAAGQVIGIATPGTVDATIANVVGMLWGLVV